MSSADGNHRGLLIGYGPVADPGQMRVSMGGELGRGSAELLDACRAHIRGMPVSRVYLDLSALAKADEAGARDLFVICRRLRLDGFQVDVHGMRAQVRTVLHKLGLSLCRTGLSVPARERVPEGPMDAA